MQYKEKSIAWLLAGLCLTGTINAQLVHAESRYNLASVESTADSAEQTMLQQYSHSLALQAANWGYPAVVMYGLRYNDVFKSGAKAKPNTFWRLEQITSPELAEAAGYVTPNVNVIYGFGFFDLDQEPIILSVPDSDGRYYMVQLVDMWTNSFAYVGGMTTGYHGGKFAIVGPGWQGELPADVERIDAPTRWVLLQPRVHVVDDDDLPAAQDVLAAIATQGLSEYLGKPALALPDYDYPAPEFINPKLPVSAMALKEPTQFWHLLAHVLNENPPPADQLNALMPLFAPIGLQHGAPWQPTALMPETQAAMTLAAEQVPRLNTVLNSGQSVNGWIIPGAQIGAPGTDYYQRAIVARVGLTANVASETIYFLSDTDHQGKKLDGTQNYTLTFTELPPYIEPGFWSITLYSSANNYTVANSINRYALGSDNALQKNADGSVTIYIQQETPGADKETNWLPSGDGAFYLILRAYAPDEKLVMTLSDPQGENSYTPPTVVAVG